MSYLLADELRQSSDDLTRLGASGMQPASGEVIYWLSKDSVKRMRGHVGHKVEVVEEIREIVRRNGFTPKAAKVRVAGRVVRQGSRSVLAVTGTDVVYTLAEHPEGKGKLSELEQSAKDQPAVVSGHVPESQPRTEAPLTLQVREFTLSPR